MPVFVSGRHIPQPGMLSEVARLALTFVDGGVQWLEWAAGAPEAHYEFPDETVLLEAVQQGLHAAPLTVLPRTELAISPLKLMTLGPADLRALAKAEAGDDSALLAVQIKEILAAHKLLTRSDIAAGAAFLRDVGVGDAALFQCMQLEDHFAIYGLLQLSQGQNAQNPELQKEAAAFGVRQGRTPAEFVDYYKAYLHHVAKLDALDWSPARREQLADEALHALLPLLFDALDCPQVRGLVAPAEVEQAISAWLARGKSIGFSRISEGVQQIIRHTAYKTEAGDAARAIIDQYRSGARALLAAVKPKHGHMRQDGASCVFPVRSDEAEAELQLDSTGVISLARYFSRAKGRVKAEPSATIRQHKERGTWRRPKKRNARR